MRCAIVVTHCDQNAVLAIISLFFLFLKEDLTRGAGGDGGGGGVERVEAGSEGLC